VNFQLGKLVQTDLLDRITFNGDVKGLLNQKTHDFSAAVSGKIDSLFLNDYQYKNIDWQVFWGLFFGGCRSVYP